MKRITAEQLLIAVCVIILVYLWYRRRRQVESPPRKALDPSLTGPEKVKGSRGLTGSSRPSLEVLYPSRLIPRRSRLSIFLSIPMPPIDNSNRYYSIVAVQGLGSNVDWSWTWQDKKSPRPPVHWLKDADMPPRVIPHARIIAYDYELRWHANAPKIRLELCGEELIKSLHSFRTDAQEHPTIFVAHSLGGLVVLHGLLHADRTELLKYLPAYKTLKGFTFGRWLAVCTKVWNSLPFLGFSMDKGDRSMLTLISIFSRA
ncbi:hypothetical protein F5Y19DRAFT_492559 [Xylariaceae sp. FL1651]|nr:hypothetical protein F5Y19DRAFT_492559 [Xylariaceae sp. FL1651]